MRLRFIAFVSLLCVAEITASWIVWNIAPRHSLEIRYAGFWSFESGRLIVWALSVCLYFVIWTGLRFRVRPDRVAGNNKVHQRRKDFLVLGGLCGALFLLLELLTSGIYWRMGRSAGLRELYQSPYYLGRVPQSGDLGLPSFLGYLWVHFTIWAVVVLVCLGVWYLWHKLRRQRSEWPTSEDGSPISRGGVT
jgi:hypothetical protein